MKGVNKMLLKDIMQKKVVSLPPDTTIRQAAKKMKDRKVGYIVITNTAKMLGCVTDRDIALWLADGKNPDETRIDSIMKKSLITAKPDTDIFDASKLMAKNKVRRLPVVTDSRLVGLVSISDIAGVMEEEVDNFFHVEEAYHI